jgi:hypothetical protein
VDSAWASPYWQRHRVPDYPVGRHFEVPAVERHLLRQIGDDARATGYSNVSLLQIHGGRAFHFLGSGEVRTWAFRCSSGYDVRRSASGSVPRLGVAADRRSVFETQRRRDGREGHANDSPRLEGAGKLYSL